MVRLCGPNHYYSISPSVQGEMTLLVLPVLDFGRWKLGAGSGRWPGRGCCWGGNEGGGRGGGVGGRGSWGGGGGGVGGGGGGGRGGGGRGVLWGFGGGWGGGEGRGGDNSNRYGVGRGLFHLDALGHGNLWA